ncbi:MAG: RidA family protein [Chloroflexi bacterium]|nr:RidA family protein [Chloroflexota bacterium]
MPLVHLNPSTLHVNPAFSQGVLIQSPGALLVVGGQNGTDATGAIVPGGLREQTVQALRNVLTVLADAGCTQEHVAKLTIHLVAPADIRAGFAAAQEVWGPHPAAITVLQVAALGRPEALVEIDALAQVPAGG